MKRTPTIYRRRYNSDVWHFIKSCYWYPLFPAISAVPFPIVGRSKRPTTGHLCDHCQAKQRRAQRGRG